MMNYLKYEDLSSTNCTEKSVKKKYPEFYEYIMTHYPKELPWLEKLYWFYNKLNSRPLCRCGCGAETAFMNLRKGYREFYSTKCVNSNKEIQDRKRQTCIKRFGVDNAMKSESLKHKLFQNNIAKYGVKNPASTESVKAKIRETNLIKYGVVAPMQSEEIRSKSRETLIERYGVEHNSRIESVKQIKEDKLEDTVEKMKQTSLKVFLAKHKDIVRVEEKNYICVCPHPECNLCKDRTFSIPKTVYYGRKSNDIESCTHIKPVSQLNKNTNIELFIQKMLEDKHIEYVKNDRSILSPEELDIYIPSHHLAIECNGTYWHSTLYKNKDYHINKYRACCDRGIQLISIWEDWMIHNRDIVKSIIYSKLGIYERRIYARQCEIREVNTKESNAFLNLNHIQGRCNSRIRLGLYYNDELVSLMTFGSRRRAISGAHKEVKGEYELLRYCSKLNTQVVGGAERLLKHFIRDNHPKTIISFSSNDISNGDLYKRLGFEKVAESSSYWYIDKNGIRYHRFSFTKDAIVRRGWRGDKNGWTEEDEMLSRGYMKIIDSGQTKWRLNV